MKKLIISIAFVMFSVITLAEDPIFSIHIPGERHWWNDPFGNHHIECVAPFHWTCISIMVYEDRIWWWCPQQGDKPAGPSGWGSDYDVDDSDPSSTLVTIYPE